MTTAQSNKLRRASKGCVRIVSGLFRGRVIYFPALPLLRPTPLRLRETLFNWLVGEVQGRDCLDLFAGSGALGFECASRGAAAVTLVDSHPLVVRALRASANTLKAGDHVQIIKANAKAFADRQADSDQRFDLVFVDPPFAHNISPEAMAQMVAGLMKPGGCLYLETEERRQAHKLDVRFIQRKSARVGDVRGCLYEYRPECDSAYRSECDSAGGRPERP